MSEFYFQAPTSEEVSALYNGMTFQEFKLLDDEAVWALRLREHEQWSKDCKRADGLDDTQFWQAYDRTQTMNNFVKWRVHGIPDRDMSDWELSRRVAFDIDIRRRQDSSYGELTRKDRAHLSEAEWELTWLAIDEADRTDHEQPVVTEYSDATERLGVSFSDLVQKGVLETYEIPPDVVFRKASVGYVLAGKFAAYALVNRYRAAVVGAEI